MDLAHYTLDKSFQILGKWTPDYLNFQQAISGTLYYDTDGMTLEIYGAFEFIPRTERIYGFSQDGKLLWIPSVVSRKENQSTPGYSVKKFTVHECFIFDLDLFALDLTQKEAFEAIFKDATNDFKVNELTFETNHLFAWFGENLHFQNAKEHLTIPHGTMESNSYTYKQLELFTRWIQALQTSTRQIKITSRAEIALKNQEKSPVFFKHLYQEAQNIKKLIELFCEDDNFYDRIAFQKEENSLAFAGCYFINQRASRSPSLFTDTLLTLHDLKEDFNTVLQHYSAKSEKLDLVVDTYLNEFYLNETNETKILNSIRNLEIYHRNFVEGNLPEHTDEALDIERKKINQFIEEHVHPDYQVRMQSQVNYSPEKNLRKRLQELLQMLPDVFFMQLGIPTEDKRKSRAISSFAYHVVETRNYYTHRDSPDRYPGRFKTVEELIEANHILRKICLYYIYDELGIEESLILRALQ